MIFIFDIPPVAQARPRFAKRGKFVHVYDPKTTAEFKQLLHNMAKIEMHKRGAEPYDSALLVRITFYRDIQKSISKINRAKRVVSQVLPDKKPDT